MVYLVWFYGISTLIVHLMPNSFYTYIKYDLHNIFKTSINSFFAQS